MTNTRITDPEVLEFRFPVCLLRFAIRRGSGGSGQHRGGDGVIRQFEFLAPMTVSLLSQRRDAYRPFGLHGGLPGEQGENLLNGDQIRGSAQFAVETGDVLTIKTPGGGGLGSP
jgi:5-oxoprolinase (ATP-hydrolysing)